MITVGAVVQAHAAPRNNGFYVIGIDSVWMPCLVLSRQPVHHADPDGLVELLCPNGKVQDFCACYVRGLGRC